MTTALPKKVFLRWGNEILSSLSRGRLSFEIMSSELSGDWCVFFFPHRLRGRGAGLHLYFPSTTTSRASLSQLDVPEKNNTEAVAWLRTPGKAQARLSRLLHRRRAPPRRSPLASRTPCSLASPRRQTSSPKLTLFIFLLGSEDFFGGTAAARFSARWAACCRRKVSSNVFFRISRSSCRSAALRF